MNLPLDDNDKRKLIELAYLGEWLINAHHDPEHQDDAARAALQQVLADAGRTEGVGKDVETGDYYLDEAWTERLYNHYIADYDDHVFWDELTERMAQRDLGRERDVPTDEINRDDDLLALRPLEDVYRREFENNGIDHLEIGDNRP
ncbi:hypothetical protein HJC99_00765 [Candidatus Saccharibacteria bacterium]|nr:hypothetical protein [Candidatus Saccharibacteria bacterium]